MHVMIVLMFLPLFALPIFWLLPAGIAAPVYAVCVLISATAFWLMRRSEKIPVATGARGLIGRDAEVVSQIKNGTSNDYFVRVEGELWSARSADALAPGKTVTIVKVNGNLLTVEKKSVADSGNSRGDET